MRRIDDKYFIKHKNNIRDFIQRLNEKEFQDIFLGIRDNKLDLYYKGYILLSIEFKNNSFEIDLRKKFKGEKDISLNEEIDLIIKNMPLHRGTDKKTYIDRVENREKDLVIREKENYFILLQDFHNYSRKEAFSYLLRELKKVLDKKFISNGERQIQNLYVCNYNFKKNKDLYIVDMEFVNDKDITSNVDGLHGRYDMLALKKDSDDYYRIIFIELKSKKDAFKGKSGINDHIDDMDKYISEYNKNESLVKNHLKKNIEKIIEQKQELKLLDFDISKINYDNPEFWILFDMVDDIMINSKDDIEKKMNSKMHEMVKSNATLRLFIGNNGEFRKEI